MLFAKSKKWAGHFRSKHEKTVCLRAHLNHRACAVCERRQCHYPFKELQHLHNHATLPGGP